MKMENKLWEHYEKTGEIIKKEEALKENQKEDFSDKENTMKENQKKIHGEVVPSIMGTQNPLTRPTTHHAPPGTNHKPRINELL